MKTIDNIELLQAVIAAHPSHQIVGKTRLQKTIYLLQRLGLPTSYEFEMHFYGPYSDELTDDAHFAVAAGLISEDRNISNDGVPYYTFRAKMNGAPRELGALNEDVAEIAKIKDPVLLELAATYDAFRTKGQDGEEALESLRDKKGDKCSGGRDQKAINFLEQLGLQYA